MPLNNTQKLQALGVAGGLAKELTAQITANVGNSLRLKELALGAPLLCDYVASSITADTFNVKIATERGMDSVLAPMLKKMIEGTI